MLSRKVYREIGDLLRCYEYTTRESLARALSKILKRDSPRFKEDVFLEYVMR